MVACNTSPSTSPLQRPHPARELSTVTEPCCLLRLIDRRYILLKPPWSASWTSCARCGLRVLRGGGAHDTPAALSTKYPGVSAHWACRAPPRICLLRFQWFAFGNRIVLLLCFTLCKGPSHCDLQMCFAATVSGLVHVMEVRTALTVGGNMMRIVALETAPRTCLVNRCTT
jgi:hypothetical protein